jgi:hypothetical protein
MSFSKVYGGVLLPFVKNYKEARNDKERKKILRNAADAVSQRRNELEDQGGQLPKDLPNV